MVESFRIDRRFDEKRDDCKVRSSKELIKLLMRDCFSTIALRQMTEEEQNQMAVFKEQQKGESVVHVKFSEIQTNLGDSKVRISN